MPKKILLADDSVTIQKVISITFSSEDYELTIVGDGESAIQKAKELKPDVILADVAMPGRNGYEVCEAVKIDPALKNTPVLLLAGTFEPLNRDEARRVNADDSIIKPFESQDLIDKVDTLLKKAESARGRAEEVPSYEAPSKEEASWEQGDYLSFAEEFEEKKEEKGAGIQVPDLDFIEGGALFEEPSKEFALTEEKGFAGFEPVEEPLKPEQKPEPAKPAEIPAFEAEPFTFEPLKEEPVEFEPFGKEPSEAAAPPAAPAPAEERPPQKKEYEFLPEEFQAVDKDFWAAPEKAQTPEGIPEAETDLLEAPKSFLTEPAPWEKKAEPLKESAPPPAEPKAGPASFVKEAGETVVSRAVKEAEERSRGRVIEEAGARLVDIGSIPKAQIEEMVAKIAREVIEEIAWEVVPDIAEEVITAEFSKFKEAWARLK